MSVSHGDFVVDGKHGPSFAFWCLWQECVREGWHPRTRISVVEHGMIWKVCDPKRMLLHSLQGAQIWFCCFLASEREGH